MESGDKDRGGGGTVRTRERERKRESERERGGRQVLADYASESLNLEDPAAFRDLSRPMGAQSPPQARAARPARGEGGGLCMKGTGVGLRCGSGVGRDRRAHV